MQYFYFPQVITTSVKLIIMEAIPGTSRDTADTSISEVHFWGE